MREGQDLTLRALPPDVAGGQAPPHVIDEVLKFGAIDPIAGHHGLDHGIVQ